MNIKVHVRGDKLTVTLPARIREKVAVRDGDEIEVTAEGGRIVLTPTEALSPGDLGRVALLAGMIERLAAGLEVKVELLLLAK